MNQAQLKTIRILFKLTLMCLCVSTSLQAVPRSHGVGLRVSFWNVTNQPTRIDLGSYGESATINIGGTGSWVYFFSRMYENWFLEFHLGAVAGVHEEHDEYQVHELDATAVIPLLVGLRYDVLSPRFPSKIQPYLSLGGGPYWTTSVMGTDVSTGGEQKISSDLLNGMYFGGGMDLLMTSWAAFSMEMKYHFVNFKPAKGFSGLEVGLGLTFMWGKTRETFQIQAIRPVVNDIYPAYYQFYNLVPLALITIKNVASYPIEVNIKSRIATYSERMQESGFLTIPRGKTKDIPISVIFGKTIQNVDSRQPAMLDIIVEARAGQTITRNFSTPLTVHSRNAWDGSMDKLGYFLTPEADEVLELSRSSLSSAMNPPTTEPERLQQARLIFDNLQRRNIRYLSDPAIPFYQDDRVQFAAQTLKLGHGDCDDLVVLYASLLASVGIQTAFVEVRDPEKSIGHVYLMFNTEIDPQQGSAISSNSKRYIVRDDANGKQSIWIPVETTLLAEGFQQAWDQGALSYLEEAVLRNGIAEGWVTIFDVL